MTVFALVLIPFLGAYIRETEWCKSNLICDSMQDISKNLPELNNFSIIVVKNSNLRGFVTKGKKALQIAMLRLKLGSFMEACNPGINKT